MLQIAYIRENKEEVIKRLAKKNMDATTLIELVVDLDEKRRATQVELDTIKAESNKLSKDIGELMKSGEKAKAEKCEAMEGLLEEAEELMKDHKEGTMVRDAALIAGAQKIEHYEIATYGTLATYANLMGHKKAEKLLRDILKEEKDTDSKLTKVAESLVNEAAMAEEQ